MKRPWLLLHVGFFVLSCWPLTVGAQGKRGAKKPPKLPSVVETSFRPAYIYGGGDISKVPNQGFPQKFPNLKWGWSWRAEVELTEEQLTGFQGVVASFGGSTRGVALWIQDGAANALYFPGGSKAAVGLTTGKKLAAGSAQLSLTTYANRLITLELNGERLDQAVTPILFYSIRGNDKFAVGRDIAEPVLSGGLVTPDKERKNFGLVPRLNGFQFLLARSEPEIPDKAKPRPTPPFKPKPSKATGPEMKDERIASAKQYLAKGRLQFGTLDEVESWRFVGNAKYRKKRYQAVVVKFRKQTQFGSYTRDLRCLLNKGKVFKWIDVPSGEERK